MTLATWATALLLAAGPDAPPPPPPPPPPMATAPVPPPPPPGAPTLEKDPKALALVKKMSDRLTQAKSFTLKAHISLELPVAGGGLATFFNEATAVVQRPDKLAATRTGDLPEFRFAYDGKSMIVSSPANGQWGTIAAPPTLDGMILAASEQGGISFPFDELLVADPYAAITRDLVQATLVGQTTIGGKKTDHVLLASPGLTLQLWLDPSTALPVRVAIVYTDQAHKPHFSVDYSDWKLDHRVRASDFELPKPKGATQVEFRAAAAAFRWDPLMRTSHLVAAALALAVQAIPLDADAWVVVRARPVYVAPMPVYVAPMPVYVAPATVYVESAPAPAPAPAPPITDKLPVNTTMWTLPSGCNEVSSAGTSFFVCGPNWLRAYPSDRGTYYAVVPPP